MDPISTIVAVAAIALGLDWFVYSLAGCMALISFIYLTTRSSDEEKQDSKRLRPGQQELTLLDQLQWVYALTLVAIVFADLQFINSLYGLRVGNTDASLLVLSIRIKSTNAAVGIDNEAVNKQRAKLVSLKLNRKET